MHDPMTVAFEIRYPWYTYRPWPTRRSERRKDWEDMTAAERVGCDRAWKDGYRDSFATIWHVDPERNGTDDSCGYSVPHLSQHQLDRLKNWAWHEGKYPYFLRRSGREWKGTRHEAEAMYRGLLLWIAHMIEVPMTFEQAAREAAMVIHKPDCIDTAKNLCFEPGYHTNFKEDTAEQREEFFYGMICGMARWILKDRRPWYRHPKWHFWHWRIQVHCIQSFKRWAFSRCCKCGGRFRWGEAPCSGDWNATGPLWFRSEKNTYHGKCHVDATISAKVADVDK